VVDVATTNAVVGGSGENAFLLTRPVSLATLVTARSFSGGTTDIFDARFLFPILVAAALVWGLGARGAVVAAATSVIVQVGVTAVAQAGQILLVRLVPPARRRPAWWWRRSRRSSAATVRAPWRRWRSCSPRRESRWG